MTWYWASVAEIQAAAGVSSGVSFDPAQTEAVNMSVARKIPVGVDPVRVGHLEGEVPRGALRDLESDAHRCLNLSWSDPK